jgi:NAD(P)-dependent dehydrogenase (short-subunit alcohol dehydrogenase family)
MGMVMADLPGKTMIISGVGPGLGRRVALAAVREGANVVLGARTGKTLQDVAREIDSSGRKVACVSGDIVKDETAHQLTAAAVEHFGGVDCVVNCAAYSPLGGLEQAGDFSEWRTTLEVNLIGSMQMVRAALPHLRRAQGSIVFVSSQTQWFPPPEAPQMAYAASKGALWGAMHHLALEIGPSKVRVNEVAPGWMYGPPIEMYLQMSADAQGISRDEAKIQLTKEMALNDMATDADVAEAIVFLASPRSRGITGQTLFVNAGEYMH